MMAVILQQLQNVEAWIQQDWEIERTQVATNHSGKVCRNADLNGLLLIYCLVWFWQMICLGSSQKLKMPQPERYKSHSSVELHGLHKHFSLAMHLSMNGPLISWGMHYKYGHFASCLVCNSAGKQKTQFCFYPLHLQWSFFPRASYYNSMVIFH